MFRLFLWFPCSLCYLVEHGGGVGPQGNWIAHVYWFDAASFHFISSHFSSFDIGIRYRDRISEIKYIGDLISGSDIGDQISGSAYQVSGIRYWESELLGALGRLLGSILSYLTIWGIRYWESELLGALGSLLCGLLGILSYLILSYLILSYLILSDIGNQSSRGLFEASSVGSWRALGRLLG